MKLIFVILIAIFAISSCGNLKRYTVEIEVLGAANKYTAIIECDCTEKPFKSGMNLICSNKRGLYDIVAKNIVSVRILKTQNLVK